jgi:hypothetical protein
METTLHQQLKREYAGSPENTEVTVGRYRIDALRDDELIEIQFGSLSAIGDKCRRLLERHRLRVVKPVIIRTRIAKRKKPDGPIVSRRMSPSRGSIVDVFDDLIYFTRVFPDRNLTLEIVGVHVEQVRVPRKGRRRWHRNYQVQDTLLEKVVQRHEIRQSADLLQLLAWPDVGDRFNTADLALAIDRPRWFAQKVAYVLRKTGAVETLSRTRSGVVYQPAA